MEQECINYLAAHITQALAEDCCILGVQVELVATKLILIGQVETEERRQAAEQVATELVPEGVEVVNQLWVPKYDLPLVPEALH